MESDNRHLPHVNFIIGAEYLGADGLWNPRDDEPPLQGGFQLNLFGSREHYLKLAKAIRAFAERDTSTDGDYHEHFEGLTSVDGKVRFHVIMRKDDVGDSSFQDFFPPRPPKTVG